ncbi:GNAT family N-acetyltransferase [bacterium]|nr:GNAT family N-acetyltransferase [bacterium]
MTIFKAKKEKSAWEYAIVPCEQVLAGIKPGMRIFLGTGAAEPRTFIRHLLQTDTGNLQDLELIQLASFNRSIYYETRNVYKFRLKTFFSGWVASEAILEGRVDLIPSRSALVPNLIKTGKIPIDVSCIQITPPDQNGYCSLGIAVDAARQAIESASIVVGEINTQIPYTYGDTLIPVSEFDYLISSTDPPYYFARWELDETISQVAANVAEMIKDKSCLSFSIGPLFEALGPFLTKKHDLGIYSLFITDSLMDLIKSGAVTNRFQMVNPRKSVISYVLGTQELMSWLDCNPLIEMQSVDKVLNPLLISSNPQFVAIIPARKVDLSGRIALHQGKGNISTGPEGTIDIFNGAEMSSGGHSIFALPSRNRKGDSNICLSVEDMPNQFNLQHSVDMVITEYGVAELNGSSIRERAQSLVDIAHPEDRQKLILQGKERNILYRDQLYSTDGARNYPSEISQKWISRNSIEVRFRAIKLSDEERMRRFFYRFSEEDILFRYFTPIRSMPHWRVKEYVNVDHRKTLSIVGLIGDPGEGKIIAEGRYAVIGNSQTAEIALMVDQEYQRQGIATQLFKMLIQSANQRDVGKFSANVMTANSAVKRVFEKSGILYKTTMEDQTIRYVISLESQ